MALPSLFLPYQKPPDVPQIDVLHPLSRGLVGLWLCNEGGGVPRSPVRPGVRGSLTGATWGRGDRGNALKFNANGDIFDTGGWTNNATTAGTAICRIYQAFTPAPAASLTLFGHRSGATICEWNLDVSGHTFFIGWYNSGTDTRVTFISDGTANCIQNTWQWFGFTWDPSGTFVYRFSTQGGTNGLLASNGSAPATVNVGVDWGWGQSNGFGTGVGAGTILDCGAIWSRRLFLPELQLLVADPYALVTPQEVA